MKKIITFTMLCLSSMFIFFMQAQQYYNYTPSYNNASYSTTSTQRSKPYNTQQNARQYSNSSQRPQARRTSSPKNRPLSKNSSYSYNQPTPQISSKQIWCASLSHSMEPNVMIMAKLLCQ
jgi:hypothetical protein